VAAGAVLAVAAAWATPDELPFADLRQAYDLGRVTEARALARKYLASSEAAVREAKSDDERSRAVGLVQSAATEMLFAEANFPMAGRLRKSADLLESAKRALETAGRAPVPQKRLAGVRYALGMAYADWLAAADGIKPRAERDKFFRAHAGDLAIAGWSSLEKMFPAGDHRPKSADAERVAALAGTFVRGYAARDGAAIAATTRLSSAEAVARLNGNDLTFFAGTTDRVSKVAFRPIGAEWIWARFLAEGNFLVYLPDVRMQLVAPDGTAYSKTVDRTLSMYVDATDAPRLEIRVDESRAEHANIPY
jgi:hypothetical protein